MTRDAGNVTGNWEQRMLEWPLMSCCRIQSCFVFGLVLGWNRAELTGLLVN